MLRKCVRSRRRGRNIPVAWLSGMTALRCLLVAAVAAACLYLALATSSASPPGRHAAAASSTVGHATRLDPALRRALDAATRAARRDGIAVRVTSGLRTPAEQRRLLDEAVVRYGSERVARQFVNTPERSTHVRGLAVDVGPTDAAYWMIQHGAEFGLCQIYANEIWHFERVVRPGGTCPPLKPDASDG
jgi:LAS superfamily LD-carboxypeptidase LdcB